MWTLQYVKGSVRHPRHPVLPDLRPCDGWAPIEDFLHIIREENRQVKIMFEHQSEPVTDDQGEQCYTWVDSVLRSAR